VWWCLYYCQINASNCHFFLTFSPLLISFLQLAEDFSKSVPAAEEHLLPVLRQILVDNFGATPKSVVSA
jgi:hypothetical protein